MREWNAPLAWLPAGILKAINALLRYRHGLPWVSAKVGKITPYGVTTDSRDWFYSQRNRGMATDVIAAPMPARIAHSGRTSSQDLPNDMTS